jgi:DNA-binding LacI/PurR family transcriptional regulator
VNSALAAINDQSGRAARFIDVLPIMGVLTRQAITEYQPTTILLDTLDALADQGDTCPSLATVAKTIAQRRPTFALQFFVAPEDRDDVRENDSGELNLEKFADGMIYSTHTTFQYKAMLYHTGILTTRGNDTKAELDPTSAVWALEDPLVT